MPRVATTCLRAFCVICVAALIYGCGGRAGAPQLTPPEGPSTMQSVAGSTESLVAAAPRNWDVQAGASTVDYALEDLDFYAGKITVDAGDTVTWRVAAAEPHTVSFLLPNQKPPVPPDPNALQPRGGKVVDGTKFVSSGLLGGGQRFTVTFSKPGTYVYNCLLHFPEMMGTIVVQKAGTPYPHPQSYYTHIGSDDEWADLGAAQRSIALFPFPNHGTTIGAGISPGLNRPPPAQSTVVRFITQNNRVNFEHIGDVTIKVGTTLKWVNLTNNEPHTVTLPPAGKPLPSTLGPFAPPIGGTTYDGTKLTNSGPFFPGQSYTLKFTKAGTFKYYCLFHDGEGMLATITVKP